VLCLFDGALDAHSAVVAPVHVAFRTVLAFAAFGAGIAILKQTETTVLTMGAFLHSALNAESAGIAPLADTVSAQLATGAKIAVIVHKAFFAVQAELPGFRMTFKAETAGLYSLLALAAAAAAPAALRAKRDTLILARITFRTMIAVINGAVAAIAALLTEIDSVNTLIASGAVIITVVAETAVLAELIDTLLAVWTMVLIVAAAVGILAAMVAAVTDPVVGDELPAVLAGGLRFPREHRCGQQREQHNENHYEAQYSFSHVVSSCCFSAVSGPRIRRYVDPPEREKALTPRSAGG